MNTYEREKGGDVIFFLSYVTLKVSELNGAAGGLPQYKPLEYHVHTFTTHTKTIQQTRSTKQCSQREV
jgi:hypothetical protein